MSHSTSDPHSDTQPPIRMLMRFGLLGARGVVSPMLAESLARVVGFRNVLVHHYTTVDDAIVMAALERLDEFDEFVTPSAPGSRTHDDRAAVRATFVTSRLI